MALACGSDGEPSDGGTPPASLSPTSLTVAPATITTGSLPSGFPSDFPLYDGAVPLSGSESTDGIVASLDTPAGFPEVAAFYKETLSQSPWRIVEERPVEGLEQVLYTFANEDDESRGGTISIVRPRDHLRTLIYITLQKQGG